MTFKHRDFSKNVDCSNTVLSLLQQNFKQYKQMQIIKQVDDKKRKTKLIVSFKQAKQMEF